MSNYEKYERLRKLFKDICLKFELGMISFELYSRWCNRINKIDNYFIKNYSNEVSRYYKNNKNG